MRESLLLHKAKILIVGLIVYVLMIRSERARYPGEYDEDNDHLEEKKEGETGELDQITTNQVF